MVPSLQRCTERLIRRGPEELSRTTEGDIPEEMSLTTEGEV